MHLAGKIARHNWKDLAHKKTSMHEPPHCWILVANEGMARVLARTGRDLDVLGTVKYVEKAETEISNSTVGHSGAAGAGLHRYEPSMEQTRQGQIGFARELAAWLDTACQKNAFDRLILIAAPRTLGDMRGVLTKNVRSKLVQEINRDIAHHGDQDMKQEILRLIEGPDAT